MGAPQASYTSVCPVRLRLVVPERDTGARRHFTQMDLIIKDQNQNIHSS
jgi:hypothetical protein